MDANTSASKLLTVPEAAQALKVSQAAIRSWILRRRIHFVRVSRLVRIPSSEIERIIREGTVLPAPASRRR